VIDAYEFIHLLYMLLMHDKILKIDLKLCRAKNISAKPKKHRYLGFISTYAFF